MKIKKEMDKHIKIIEGVRRTKNDDFVFDMTNDEIDDIIYTNTSDELYFAKIDNNVYFFGYKLNNKSSMDRSQFIKWLKSFDELNPDLEAFIIRPLKTLTKYLDITDFDLFISPKSNRSKLTQFIIECYLNISQRNTKFAFIETIKSLPSKISFNFEKLKNKLGIDEESRQFKDIKRFVDNELLPKIHNLDYFSLSQNVKVKYRPFIENFLIIDEKSLEIIKGIKKGNILIVDDINTTASTLREITRIITCINPNCNIYIYTLIGKE